MTAPLEGAPVGRRVVLGLLGVTPALGAFVTGIGATPLMLILALTAFYLLLGVFFETLPLTLPPRASISAAASSRV